ncbi:MAG: mannan endo,4-beta-mannosidase [Acidobacteriota bacterium]|jgi:mannan endo-1,4-beta-mannosidase|nr:mannan endo,4-beta-mannosidase [Acidobacteriota bacterium]
MRRNPFHSAAFALLAGAALFFAACAGGKTKTARAGFVSTQGPAFVVDGHPFRFTGANVAVIYGDEERERADETLRQASLDGIRVVRIWAFGESGEDDGKPGGVTRDEWLKPHPFRRGPDDWNEEAFENVDRIISLAQRHKVRVLICLGNWWRDTGGVVRYLRWVGLPDAADDSQPFGINVERAMPFYTNDETRRLYREHVKRIVGRRNTVTGLYYRDDPTIFGYELMNEAQAPTGRWAERRAWVKEMSEYVKSLDPDHVVAPGTWGYRTSWERREWLEDHRISTIDYCDAHVYPRDDTDSSVGSPEALRDFIDNRAAAAFSIGKPLVFSEFGMTAEGFNGYSQSDWYKAFYEAAAQAGVGGATYWIFTPDPRRGYSISYSTERDVAVRTELRRAAELFASLEGAAPTARLLDSSHHLIPRQFIFSREANDPGAVPEIAEASTADEPLKFRFKPEMALRGRFEKLGGGAGYVWGSGVGSFEYVVPARAKGRWVKSVVVRAHVQPVLPQDARPPVIATRVTLFINGKDCGSRVVPVETPQWAIVEEWNVSSIVVRAQASRGLPLTVRFAVTVDADQPYGLNISNFSEGHGRPDQRPIEVEIR